MTDATSRAREVIAAYLRNIDIIPGSMAYGVTKTNELLAALTAAGLAIHATRTHAAVAREPSDEVVERVARALCLREYDDPDFPVSAAHHREWFYDLFYGDPLWKAFVADARAAIAALVQGQTQGGEDGDV